MAKTNWKMGDTVLPDDLNQNGQEINDNAAATANHAAATTGVHGATFAATANRIVQRDSDGRAKFVAPADSDDAARKAEVDAVHDLIKGQNAPSNLNDAIKIGSYRYGPETLNRPPASYGMVRAWLSDGDMHDFDYNWIFQEGYSTAANEKYLRRKIGPDEWSPWSRFWTDDNCPAFLGSNGYQKLPSGIIWQWGCADIPPAGGGVTFPIAFPSVLLGVLPIIEDTVPHSFSLYNRTITGVGIIHDSDETKTVHWLAVGY